MLTHKFMLARQGKTGDALGGKIFLKGPVQEPDVGGAASDKNPQAQLNRFQQIPSDGASLGSGHREAFLCLQVFTDESDCLLNREDPRGVLNLDVRG
jgi:hypothetical protein